MTSPPPTLTVTPPLVSTPLPSVSPPPLVLAETPLSPRLLWWTKFQSSFLQLLYTVFAPGSGAVQLQQGKNPLDSHFFQGWKGHKVVWKPLSPGSGHQCFSHSILGQLQTTVPESVLSSQHGSGCSQYLGRVLVLLRKPDHRRLLGQLPDPSLRCRLHGPSDSSSKIPLGTQTERPKLDRYNALWTIRRHWSGGLVHSSQEDRPSAVGEWNLPIHALFNNLDSHVLHPSSIDPTLGTPSSSSSSTPHSTEAPSTYTIGRDTYGHKHSPKDVLLTSAGVLSVWRGQSSFERLPPLPGCPKVNCRAEGGID